MFYIYPSASAFSFRTQSDILDIDAIGLFKLRDSSISGVLINFVNYITIKYDIIEILVNALLQNLLNAFANVKRVCKERTFSIILDKPQVRDLGPHSSNFTPCVDGIKVSVTHPATTLLRPWDTIVQVYERLAFYVI